MIAEKKINAEKVEVKPSPTILHHHLWIGIANASQKEKN
jgi:hypothetical protein